MNDILDKAQAILEKHSLCDHCIGRQFALLGYGLEDQKRGETVKLFLTMKAHQQMLLGEKEGVRLLKIMATNGSTEMAVEILKKTKKRVGKRKECHLCEGKFKLLPELATNAVERLNSYEFRTFLVGVELPPEVEEREDEFKAEFGVKHGESMRNELSRELGKAISKATNKDADYKKPDILVVVNPFSRQVSIRSNPLYIAGRYRKTMRGIPQSEWICWVCGGKGCPRCNGTGRMYAESVEELIGKPVLERALGEDISLHAAGREDIDVRMLGRGRPFVIEVKKPKKRFLDLRDLSKAINTQALGKVKVSRLFLADKDLIRELKKAEATEKVYRTIVRFDRTISDDELEKLHTSLNNATIRQQTPRRVLHRRADRVREKHIYMAKIKRMAPDRAEIGIRCQGGLYIKELVTGDDGRTDPSVAKILQVGATPLKLDVLDVIIKGL